ncbi:MAG TPA: MFS transporter, partial [Propionibacteriaceae bacterium]|nr:MFS transporter [Propionibacteriaceae bacterium]
MDGATGTAGTESSEVHAGWGVAGMLAAAQFIMVLDTTVMNVSITQVVADLHTTVVGLQTAITMYTLVMAAFMLIGGKLGDRWGAKRAFWVGLLVYGTGSLITSLSPTLGVLLVGWSFVEGLGAVLVIPAIAALTAATYQGRQRALAYGILGGVSGASMAAGPLIGGWVTSAFSWRYVFAGETVVVLVVMLFLRLIPATQGRRSRLDTPGAVLSALGLGSIVLGILRSSQWGWVTPKPGVPEVNGQPLTPLGLSPTLWLLLAGAVLLTAFSRREERVKGRGDEPLLDMALLRIPRMRAGLVVQWCQAFIIQATFFVLPLYLQTVLGFDALQTGVTILPLSAALFVFALGGSAMTGRFSPKLIVQRGVFAM